MESKEQSFYIAVILYESSSNNPGYKPLCQECFVLIKASSLKKLKKKLSHIRVKRSALSKWGQRDYYLVFEADCRRDSVLYDDFDDSNDGVELYARHFRNYEAYRSFEPLLERTLRLKQ